MQAAERVKLRRPHVLKRFLMMYENPRYLEVGVFKAKTFDKVDAALKVAVDPDFRFDHEAPERRRHDVVYHQVPSDEYFGTLAQPDDQFDVIYLDGLHTVEQTLRDFNNALHHLQPRGVIVLDDTRPWSHAAALPDLSEFRAEKARLGFERKAWMGDVYRLVYYIDTFCQSLSYRTISNNHGQTVVWRQQRAEAGQRGLAEIATLSYDDLVATEEVLRLAPLVDIVREVRQALGLRKPADARPAAG